ncbi:MAG: hypothetical protein H7Y38_06345 [Armatimonadetes bacterium]|nr:hypothetical protein [Armatimonadota bacterium]
MSPVRILQSWKKTTHFVERQGRRSVRDEAAKLAIAYGRCFYERDSRVYFLGRDAIRKRLKDAPAPVIDDWVRRADGLVVVVSANGALVTTYRNPNYLKTLKRRV